MSRFLLASYLPKRWYGQERRVVGQRERQGALDRGGA